MKGPGPGARACKTHENSSFGKLGIESRAQVVAHAFRDGVVKADLTSSVVPQ